MTAGEIDTRAARHAALGDPVRLAIVEQLATSDRAPGDLRRVLGIESNLLAHHLAVLDAAGLIRRSRSRGDGRRRYVHLDRGALRDLEFGSREVRGPALFVCTQNSARSQLAAALWTALTGATAESAGTHPAARVHPRAIAAADRAGLDLSRAVPRGLDSVQFPELVVTVCDQAHEEIDETGWLHWSIPDPVPHGRDAAFDRVVDELRDRMSTFTPAVGSE